MRRIDKTKILATEYMEWLDGLETDNVKHPQNSDKYRVDVKMNLLYCQKGVCAYTEMPLCPSELMDEAKWENGCYKKEIDLKKEIIGSLDHFDPGLKSRKFWKWENLFWVHSDVNTKKGQKDVDEILKPDMESYDPLKLLEYNFKTHEFVPHTDLDQGKRERIYRMIDVLQLNLGIVRDQRATLLAEASFHRKWDEPYQPKYFFTAYEMFLAAQNAPE